MIIKELTHLLNLYYETGVKNNNVSPLMAEDVNTDAIPNDYEIEKIVVEIIDKVLTVCSKSSGLI